MVGKSLLSLKNGHWSTARGNKKTGLRTIFESRGKRPSKVAWYIYGTCEGGRRHTSLDAEILVKLHASHSARGFASKLPISPEWASSSIELNTTGEDKEEKDEEEEIEETEPSAGDAGGAKASERVASKTKGSRPPIEGDQLTSSKAVPCQNFYFGSKFTAETDLTTVTDMSGDAIIKNLSVGLHELYDQHCIDFLSHLLRFQTYGKRQIHDEQSRKNFQQQWDSIPKEPPDFDTWLGRKEGVPSGETFRTKARLAHYAPGGAIWMSIHEWRTRSSLNSNPDPYPSPKP